MLELRIGRELDVEDDLREAEAPVLPLRHDAVAVDGQALDRDPAPVGDAGEGDRETGGDGADEQVFGATEPSTPRLNSGGVATGRSFLAG